MGGYARVIYTYFITNEPGMGTAFTHLPLAFCTWRACTLSCQRMVKHYGRYFSALWSGRASSRQYLVAENSENGLAVVPFGLNGRSHSVCAPIPSIDSMGPVWGG